MSEHLWVLPPTLPERMGFPALISSVNAWQANSYHTLMKVTCPVGHHLNF